MGVRCDRSDAPGDDVGKCSGEPAAEDDDEVKRCAGASTWAGLLEGIPKDDASCTSRLLRWEPGDGAPDCDMSVEEARSPRADDRDAGSARSSHVMKSAARAGRVGWIPPRHGVRTMAAAQAVAQQAPTRTHLTLKGSTAIVHEFFNYSVQSILYQRSIYPSEDFHTVKKFGLQMLATTDDDLADYLDRVMSQLKKWLEQGKVRRLVVAIVEKESQETVERWQFDVEVLRPGTDEAPTYVFVRLHAA